MMILKLEITGLTIKEKEDLLKQLKIIQDKVYSNLNIDYSLLTHSSNWISICQEIDDIEKALFLIKCFRSLHINHKPDTYYNIDENVTLNTSIEYQNIWK